MKKFNQTYLYRKMPLYEKELHEMIIKGDRIDKSHKSFDDIKYEVKRKNIDSTLVKLLDSDRIVLVIPPKQMPKAFKVVCVKDIREDNKVKVFIDCTGVITNKDSGYSFLNNQTVNIFISYLISARSAFIVEAKPNLFEMNSYIANSGARAFSSMVNYIIDYVGKININNAARNKSIYLASVFYLSNLLGKDKDSKSVKDLASKISGLTAREINILEIDYKEDSFDDIEKFIELVAEILHVKGLTIDLFIEKWMFLYGTGTVFACELFVSFAQCMTDTYIGAYLNNQKTIEKITKQNMIEFSKNIIKIGSDS